MAHFDPEQITFFAKTDARGQAVPFGIKAKDRQRHMYVVGKTGMGKSTLLENMAAQDIKNGEGMAFIDPHGSAAETLLDYVPPHRVDDVVYFAPFDMAHPVSFNVMEDVGPDKRHLVVSGLMSTFKKIWVDAWSARMEYILTNTLLALIEYPDTTLLSVNRMLADKAYRDRVVDYVKDPAVKAYWTEEFANYTERFAAEALPAIQNKIGQFTGNPLIRNIIGQPHSSFDIRELMDNRKILIMNLSKGLIGETNANLLGSMLTTRIYLAAMSRADLPVAEMKQMPNFYFYVDEFQSFANSTFANILSEARKYHLNLIIAHQYIEQMEEDVRSAVFGNVGTTIAFRVGPFDAEVLETVFTPRFLAADLVNLGFAQIYLTLMIDGIGSQPFSAVTLPPVEMPAVSSREMVISASRRLYAKERAAVEEQVQRLHTPEKKDDDQRGGKSGNGGGKGKPNNNGGGRPNGGGFNNNGKPGGKPPVSKSPDELRSILASVAGTNTTTKREAEPTKADTPAPRSNESAGEESQSKRPAATESTPKPVTTPEPTRPRTDAPKRASAPAAELKDLLASVRTGGADGGYSKPKENKTPANDSAAKNDLRAALAGMMGSGSTSQSEQQPAPKAKVEHSPQRQSRDNAGSNTPRQANDSRDRAPSKESASAKESSNHERPRSVTLESLQATLKRITESVYPPKPQPEAATTTESPQRGPRQNDPLDPGKIKRMLRHSGNERSPFHDAY